MSNESLSYYRYLFYKNWATTTPAVVGNYTVTFTDANLTAGVYSISNHGLQRQYVNVTVYNNNGVRIRPDDVDVSGGVGQVDIDLSGFGTLTGTWTVVIS